MKKKKSLGILVLLFMIVVAGAYVVNTFAKYSSTVNKTGSVTVASWNFATDNTGDTFTVNIAPTADASTLVSGKIAPGTSGSFVINVKNTSDVGANVSVALGSVTGTVPTNMKFYSDSAHTTEITPGSFTKTGVLAAGNSTGLNVTIYWAWPYETPASSSAGDAADTTAGTTPATLSIPVTITGTQVAPSTTAITSRWNS